MSDDSYVPEGDDYPYSTPTPQYNSKKSNKICKELNANNLEEINQLLPLPNDVIDL